MELHMAYIVYKSATLFLLKQARLIPLASMHTSGVISLIITYTEASD